MLSRARRPLVAGLGELSTEAQRVAVAIADRLGGVADWTSSDADAAATVAFQTVGAVSATYGEAAERCDLLVYWGCQPTPLPGFGTIGNAESRKIVDVGGKDFPLKPGSDYEAINVLRALAAGIEVDPDQTRDATGVELSSWRRLVEQLSSASYAVIVRGRSVAEDGHESVAALTQLAQELQSKARVATVPPPGDSNHSGAENVLAWQTGFPLAVDFARGYPRYGPSEFTAQALIDRGEVDAVLDLGPTRPGDRVEDFPRLALISSDVPGDAAVAFRVTPLSESTGTYYRSDGLALRRSGNPTSGELAAEEVLRQIHEQVARQFSESE